MMKRALLAATVLVATLLAPSFASAGDRYRGYSRSRDYSYYGGGHSHGYSHGSRSSFGFSFGLFTGPTYYRPAYRPAYYRPYYQPYYRPYYAPAVVYVDPAPVYYPPPTYYRPVYRDYYYDDCGYRSGGYYSRPSVNLSLGYSRYYR